MSSTEIVTIIVAVLGSDFLKELVRGLFGKKNKLNMAVCAILRDRILHLCEKYIEAGEITHKQFESLMSLYENYKNLGGNGFVDDEMELVKELPRTV